jgi:nitroreductase
MELIQAIHQRHSVRAFSPEPVSHEDIQQLIEAGAAAPSAYNSQPWRFHIAIGASRDRVNEIMALSTVHLTEYMEVLGPERFQQVEDFYANLGHAPIVIACSVPETETELDRLNEYLSAGAAIENILLAATALGLGSCNITFSFWVRGQLLEAFEIPEGREIVSLVLIGHPGEKPVAPEHREDVATILD